MSVLMNFAMFPTDKGISVSPFVAKIVDCVRQKGFKAQLTSMGTIVETNTLTEALGIIDDAYKTLEADCNRVYISVNFDVKKGSLGRIDEKVKSVEEKLK
ncbi:MAG: MTH1187 family thiamine-binding protein [Bacteroidales bacterium]